MLFWFRNFVGTPRAGEAKPVYDDPSVCGACSYNVRVVFWDRERHNNDRLHSHWDRLERTGQVEWTGELGSVYQVPVPDSPFLRGEGVRGKERLYDLVNSGGGRTHTCAQGRMPCNLNFTPFVPRGLEKPREGFDAYEAEIVVTLVGMVEQSPAGKWQWIVAEEINLPLPKPLRGILGDGLQIEGWFRFRGEKASRQKKRKVRFHPRYEKKLRSHLPETTRLRVLWEEYLLPAPCVGVTLWAAYATMTGLWGLTREVFDERNEEEKRRKEEAKKRTEEAKARRETATGRGRQAQETVEGVGETSTSRRGGRKK